MTLNPEHHGQEKRKQTIFPDTEATLSRVLSRGGFLFFKEDTREPSLNLLLFLTSLPAPPENFTSHFLQFLPNFLPGSVNIHARLQLQLPGSSGRVIAADTLSTDMNLFQRPHIDGRDSDSQNLDSPTASAGRLEQINKLRRRRQWQRV